MSIPVVDRAAASPLLIRRLLAVVLAVTAVALFAEARAVRVAEAWLQTVLLGIGQLNTQQVGTSILAELNERWVGIALTTGCSVGPLIALFLLGSAPFVWWRDLPVRSVVVGVTQLAVVLFVANQLRIAVIVLAMRFWGIEKGYELSHVFFGSAITTVGFVIGAVLLARSFSRGRKAAAS